MPKAQKTRGKYKQYHLNDDIKLPKSTKYYKINSTNLKHKIDNIPEHTRDNDQTIQSERDDNQLSTSAVKP